MRASKMSTPAAGIALIVGLLVVCPPALGGSWLSVAPDGSVSLEDESLAAAPQVSARGDGEVGLSVSVNVAGLLVESAGTSQGEFAIITWPQASRSGAIGAPDLPVVRRLFVVPPGAEVAVTTRVELPAVIDLAATGLPPRVMPVQPPIPKLPGAHQNAVFRFDQSVYAQDADAPVERVTVEELGIVRGQRLFMLEIHPVAYNPGRAELLYWSQIAVELTFTGVVDAASPLNPLPGLDRLVLNPEALPTSPGRATGNYLIVVASAYESAIGSFAAAKTAQGFTVTTHPVSPGTSASDIKSYIASLWGGADSPDYLLLVGDTDTIPHWTGGGAGSPATDLPYACMDTGDDWYPEIPIGRFPVRSTDHLSAIVDKTLYYENGPLEDPDYVKRAVFMASEDNYVVSEGTHNWVISTYMEPQEIECDKLYCHTYSATTQQVRDSFNDGRFFGIYSGHGGTYSWADGPPFSQSDVNGLTNANLYPFVMSFACITGTYTVSECFTETWIRAPNKGALAIYGSSVNSYWTEDDVLEKRLFDAIYDADDDVPAEVAPVWIDTLMRYLAQMGSGSTTRRYFEMYNLMGDPSLRFPGAGDPLTITCPDGPPEFFAPETPTIIVVQIDDGIEVYVPESGTLHYRFDGGSFLTDPLTPLGGNLYEATVPAAGCSATPEFFFSATGDGGTTVYHPANGAAGPFTAVVATVITVIDDDCETDQGWTVENDPSLIEGAWERGIPLGGGTRGDPLTDFDESGQCFLTANRPGDSDVDGGPTRLISPTFDLTGVADPVLSYAYWFSNDDLDEDRLNVEISQDGGSSWTLLESIAGSAEERGWSESSFHINDYIPRTAEVRVRFSATDDPNNSVTEAGIDAVEIIDIVCVDAGDGDCDGDGDVDLYDFTGFAACLTGPGGGLGSECGCLDLDGSGDIDLADFAAFQEAFGG